MDYEIYVGDYQRFQGIVLDDGTKVNTREIKPTLDKEFSALKIDGELVRSLYKLERKFVLEKEERVEFLGNALIGTPKFRFYIQDRNALFDDVIKVVDEGRIEMALRALRIEVKGKGYPIVDPTRQVASDTFNLVCVYLAHRIYNSRLSNQEKQMGYISLFKYMQYKLLGSLFSKYFKHEPKREVAEALYNSLNKKFYLKKLGSWNAVLERRSLDIMDENSIHIKESKGISEMRTDGEVFYVCTDIQGRLRDIVKTLYNELLEVKKRNDAVIVNKATYELEGKQKLKDIVNKYSIYRQYLFEILHDPRSFIKKDLIKVVIDLIKTANEDHILITLEYLCYNEGVDKNINDMLNVILEHAFEVLNAKRDAFVLHEFLKEMKGLYISSKTPNEKIHRVRDLGFKVANKATGLKNESTLASIRTAIVLYVILRVLSMDYFKNLVR